MTKKKSHFDKLREEKKQFPSLYSKKSISKNSNKIQSDKINFEKIANVFKIWLNEDKK